MAKQLYVLLGMIVGYVVAVCFGMVDFAGMTQTIRELGVVAVPQLFAYTPKFQMGTILSFCLVFIVSAVETIGDTTATCTGAAWAGISRIRRSPAPCAWTASPPPFPAACSAAPPSPPSARTWA